MVSEVVKRKIVEYDLDDSKLTRGLSRVGSKIADLSKSITGIKSTGVDNVTKSTTTLSERLGNLVSKVPIIGNVVEKITGIGKSSDTSASSLSRLSSSGKFDQMSQEATKASQSIDGIEESTSKIGKGFSMLEGVAAVALGGIATKAIAAGAQLANAFTFKPIMDGFRDYTQELESMRVLQAALGEGQTKVIQTQMKDLEGYAQTTRYSEQQMYSSLSQMVNAGVDIETATKAIKGFGNLAASSAASTNQFNSALTFGVQQALAMGYMNKQNWNSISNANMATMKFKETLIDIAKQEGTVTDEMLEQYGIQNMFNDGLADLKWMTNDVIMKAMEKYASDPTLAKMASQAYTFGEAWDAISEGVTSKWGKMWQAIFGAGEDAAKIWTPFMEIGTAVGTAIPNAMANLFTAFQKLGGQKVLFETLAAAGKAIEPVIKGVRDAFVDMFPDSKVVEFRDGLSNISKMFGNMARGMIGWLKDLQEKLVVNPAVQQAAKQIATLFLNAFQGVLGIVKAVGAALDVLIPDNLIQNAILLAGAISGLANTFINFVKGALSNLDGSGFMKFFSSLRSLVSSIWDLVTSVLGVVVKFFDTLAGRSGALGEKFGYLGKASSVVSDVFKFLAGVLDNVTDKIKQFTAGLDKINMDKVVDNLGNLGKALHLDKLFDGASKALSDFYDNLAKMASGVDVSGIFKTITDWVSRLIDKLKELTNINLGSVMDSIKGFFGGKNEDPTKDMGDNFQAVSSKGVNAFSKVKASAMEARTEFAKTNDEIQNQTVFVDELGNKYTETGTKSKSAWDYIVSGAKEALESMGKFELGGVVSGLATMLGGIAAGITNGLKSIYNAFSSNGIHGAIQALGDKFSWLGKAIDKLDLSSKAGFIRSSLKSLGDAFTTLGWIIGKIFPPLGNIFASVGKAFKNAFSVTSIQDINNLLKTIMLFEFYKSFKKMVDNFGGVAESFKGVMDGVKGTFAGLQGALKAYRFETYASGVKELGLALIAFAGALWILAQIPEDRVGSVIALTATVAAGVTAVILALTKLQKAKAALPGGGIADTLMDSLGLDGLNSMFKKIGNGAMLMAIGAALLMFGIAVEKLSKIKWEDGLKSIKMIGLILAELSATMLVSSFGGATFGSAATILSIAFTLDMILNLINKVNGIPKNNIIEGRSKLMEIGLLLTAMVALMGGGAGFGSFNVKWGSVNMGTAATILAISYSMKLLVGLIDDIAKIKKGDLEKGLDTIQTLGALITTCVALMSGSIGGSVAGKGSAGLKWGQGGAGQAALVLSLVAGIYVLGKEAEKLGSMDKGKLEQGQTAVVILAATLTIAASLISNVDAKTNEAGRTAMIIAIVGGIYALGMEVQRLGSLDTAKLAQGTIAVAAIAAVLTGMSVIFSKNVNMNKSQIATMIVAVGGLLVLGGLLEQLGQMKLSEAAMAIGVLAAALGVLVGMGAIAGIGPVAIGLQALGVALAGLGVAAAGVGTGIYLAVAALEKLLNVLARLGNDNYAEKVRQGLENLGKMAPTIANTLATLLVSAIEALAKNSGRITTALLSFFAKSITAFAKGAQQLAEPLANAINAIIDAVADLMENLDVSRLIEGFMALIGNAIKGLAEHVAEIIQPFVDLITQIVDAFAPIIEQIAPIITAVFTGISNVILAAGMGISMIINSIGDAIRNALDGIANVFLAAGTGISIAAQGIGTGIQNALNGVAAVISAVGGAISTAAMGIGAGISMALSGVANVITSVGGAISIAAQGIGTGIGAAFSGAGAGIQAALDGLANTIRAAGDGIKSAAEGIGSGIENALNGVSGVVDSIGGGIKAALDGIAGVFESMGSGAQKAGEGVKQLAQGIAILDEVGIVRTGTIITELATALGTLAGVDSGEMGTIGSSLLNIGNGIRTINNEASATKTSLDQVVTALGSLGTVDVSQIQGTADSIKNVASSVDGIKEKVMGVGLAFAGLAPTFSQSIPMFTQLGSAATNLHSKLSTIGSAGSSASKGLSSIGSAASSAASRLNSIVASSNSAGSALRNLSSAANQVGNAIGTAMNNAANKTRTAMNNVVTAVRNGVQNALSAAKGLSSNAGSEIGYHFATGMASGVRNGGGILNSAVTAVVQNAVAAARAAADVNSPSKVFRDQVGMPISEGLGAGVYKGAYFLYDAVAATIDNSVKIASGLGDAVGEVVGKVDFSDTIQNATDLGNARFSPVVDMRQVDVDGLRAMNSLIPTSSSTRYNVDYKLLQPGTANQPKHTIDTVVEGLNILNNRLYSLEEATKEQTEFVAQGQVVVANIDGYNVNKVLAAGMTEAQQALTNIEKRVKGELY